MTCCVAINAKEGDCWKQLFNCVLSLMLHKCHISHQTESTKLRMFSKAVNQVYRAQTVREAIYRVYQALQNTIPRSQLLPSSLGRQKKFSLYRVHSVIKEYVKESQSLPSSLGYQRIFAESAVFTEHPLVNTGISFLTVLACEGYYL